MAPYKNRLYNRRSAIEAKISEGKRMCGLNNKFLYHSFEGDKICSTIGYGLKHQKTKTNI